MKKFLFVFLVILFAGCVHCSKTKTKFVGETNGLNPYGKGNIKIERESYWGIGKCVSNVVFK